MFSELTNLLSTERRDALRSKYFLRLTTVALLLLCLIVVAQGVLLLPSYLYEQEMVRSRTTQLKQLSVNLATTEEQQVQADQQAIKAESAYLINLSKMPTASTALRAVLAVPHVGITLSGFTYGQSGATSASTANASRTMQLSGIADTREDLRSYDSALAALSFVTSADLPISDYAKETAIPFTITLTGSLAP